MVTDSKLLKLRLLAAATGWLRYDRQCRFVIWERSPFNEPRYRPDICAVTRQWRVIEVEIKISIADFRANSRKRGLQWRHDYPEQFYFAVPPELVERVKPELPDQCGLLTVGPDGYCGPTAMVIRPAPKAKHATRLCALDIARCVSHQSASLHRSAVAMMRAQETLDRRAADSQSSS
jgi:hypothetical protein